MSIKELNAQMRKTYHDAGYTGKNIVFAVLDTGVNAVGPLRGKVTGDADGADHGTFTASIIHEYCPDAQIWAYRCDTPNAMIEAMEDVLRRAKGETRRVVINMSLSTEAERIRTAVDACVAAGIPLVCAAGNDGQEILDMYPSCFESPITVAALDDNGKRTYFSTWHGEVDFADLGQWVEGINAEGDKDRKSGTSFAAPQVAGKIGLLLSARPGMTEPELYEALKGMSVDLDKTGRDPYTGYGFVQLPEPEETAKEETDMEERLLKLIPKPRMEGANVRELQTLLNEHGVACDVDGIFGPATDAAVRAFQEASGLAVDGIAGPKTWEALRREPDGQPKPEPSELAQGLVAYCREHISDIYVWGGNGQTEISAAWIRRMDTSETNAQRSIGFWERQKSYGITELAAYDCSGLISRYLQDKGLVAGKRNCNHLWSMCEPVARVQLIPGDLVFRRRDGDAYHVGVYIGKGRVIEAKGRDDGVVQRGIDASGTSYWTHFGRLKLEG